MEYDNTKPIILTKNKNKNKEQKQTFKAVSKTFSSSGKKKIDPNDELPQQIFVGKEIGKKIQQARLNKKITQKQLATTMNIDAKMIQKYENGTAERNGNILNKLGKHLGIKLTGKGV